MRRTDEIMQWFEYGHLPEGKLRDTSIRCSVLAAEMVKAFEDSPELTTGLRKLLEAKDCFVRAAVASLVD